jgi:hypothetical protein
VKLEIKTPFHFVAIPPRWRQRNDILCSHTDSYEIATAQAADTQVVFEAFRAHDTAGRPLDRKTELRSHDGRLYRRLGRIGDDYVTRALSVAFAGYTLSHSADPTTLISNIDTQDARSLGAISSPIASHIDHRLSSAVSYRKHRDISAWPRSNIVEDKTYPGFWSGTRNEIEFARVLPLVKDVETATVATAYEMARRQSERLLAIGEELWFETGPPVLAVTKRVLWDRSGPMTSWSQGPSMDIRLVHAEEAYHGDLSTRYYHHSAHAEALGYAQAAHAAHEIGDLDGQYRIRDFSVATVVHDERMLEFDQRAYLVWRTGTALMKGLFHSLAYSVKPSDNDENRRIARLAPVERDVFFAGAALSEASNEVLGERADYAPILAGLVELWRKRRKPGFSMTDDGQRREEDWIEKQIDEAVEAAETRPIDIYGMS